MTSFFNKLTLIIASIALASSLSAVSAFNSMGDWQKAVVTKVAKTQTYPRSAIAREIEGKAKVKVSVAADGTITSHEVVEATGEDVLDREIPKLITKLSPLPALPAGRDAITFVLPLNWSLD